MTVQVLQLGAVMALAPRFFWLDDSQRQFGPMAWWLGRNHIDGRPPLMDPDLGMAGNLVADMQYGALDPLHWVMQAVVARLDDFIVISRGYGFVAVMLLGCGALWLLLQYRVRPLLAVAGALGIASSGFFLWYGSSWWPLMWSTAWLPWLWVGLVSRHWAGVVVSGLAAWALLVSGNPYAFPFVAIVVGGQIWEQRRQCGSLRGVLSFRLVTRLAACFGGVVAALPTLLTTVQIAPLIEREVAHPDVGNVGFAIVNLADVIVGGMTLMGHTNAWNGDIGKAPAMGTLVVALPMLALATWGKAIRARGVPTALAVYVTAVVFTQLPTTVGPFRFSIRYLVIVQVALAVLALLAVLAAPDLSRRRLRIAGAIVVAQFVLAAFRAPALIRWHLLALAVTVAGLAALVVVLKSKGRAPVVPALTLLVSVAVGLPLGERMMVAVERRVNRVPSLPDPGDRPFRVLDPGYALGTTVEDYRRQAYVVDRAVTALVQGSFGPDMGWPSGILAGNSNLIAGLKPGFGSLAVWHDRVNDRWCRHFEGDTCSSPADLLAHVPGTSTSWLEALATDTLVLEEPADPEILRHLDAGWDQRRQRAGWIEFRRREPLPGRITVADRVNVSALGWAAGLARAGHAMDHYLVSTGDSAGSLTFRIPYWPGFRATIDGRRVPVSSVDQTLLRIGLPPGLSDAKLEIFYEPIGARISTPATAIGLVTILLSAAAWALARPRRRGGPPQSGELDEDRATVKS